MEGERARFERRMAEMSNNRSLRRKFAKELGFMREGWQEIKYLFEPINIPHDFGIKRFKKTGASYKDVLEYKKKAYWAFNNSK